jgi:hypothetical protein
VAADPIEWRDGERDRVLVLPVVEELAAAHVAGEAVVTVGVAPARGLSRADEVAAVVCRLLGREQELEGAVFAHLELGGVEPPEAGADAGRELRQLARVARHRAAAHLEDQVLGRLPARGGAGLAAPVAMVLDAAAHEIAVAPVDGRIEVDRVGVLDGRLVEDRERIAERGEVRVLVEGPLDAVVQEAGQVAVALGEHAARGGRREVVGAVDDVPGEREVADQVVPGAAQLGLVGLHASGIVGGSGHG